MLELYTFAAIFFVNLIPSNSVSSLVVSLHHYYITLPLLGYRTLQTRMPFRKNTTTVHTGTSGWMSTPYGHKSLKRPTIKVVQQNMVLCDILFKDSIRIHHTNMKHPASIQQLSHDNHDLFIPILLESIIQQVLTFYHKIFACLSMHIPFR